MIVYDLFFVLSYETFKQVSNKKVNAIKLTLNG